MSIRKRQQRASSSGFKVLSRKEERKIARIKDSGLSKEMAQPRAGERTRISQAEAKTLSEAESKKKGSEAASLDTNFSVKSLTPEVEDELAKWAAEEQQQQANQDSSL